MTATHPFVTRPNRTLMGLAVPVMASLVVEPLAGVVDTAFVERLGAEQAAALGAATAILSSIIWIFNFLGIGTQTEVAQATGRGATRDAQAVTSLALAISAIAGIGIAATMWPLLGSMAAWMSEEPTVQREVVSYLSIRLIGAPAGLIAYTAFGALRGLQLMRLPLWIAAAVSVFNVIADPILIFGLGPFPALGLAGAAWATTGSLVIGAVISVHVVHRRLGLTRHVDWHATRRILVVGRDMVLRTGSLLLFMLIATRAALQSGSAAGAAHQAIRQIWMLSAFMLDAFAAAAQSLVGFFLGAGARDLARSVARLSCWWGLGTGVALAVGLLAAQPFVAFLLVPPEAVAVFAAAWPVSALIQPVNALSFVTDGIHWGTGDFGFLRNAMLVSTGVGLVALMIIDTRSVNALTSIWWATALWIAVRALFGVARLWPGIRGAPLSGRSVAG